jgi:hypothetical protein
MKSSMILKIDEPCNENWEVMSAVQKGRFCNVCSKDVIDFTKFTDDEIVEYFQRRSDIKSEKICGRFKASQIESPIKKVEVPMNSFYRLENSHQMVLWVMMVLIGVFSVSCHDAPQMGKMQIQENDQKQDQNRLLDTGKSEIILMGDTVYNVPQKKNPIIPKVIKGEVSEEIHVMGEPMMQGGGEILDDAQINVPQKGFQDSLKHSDSVMTIIKGKVAIDRK